MMDPNTSTQSPQISVQPPTQSPSDSPLHLTKYLWIFLAILLFVAVGSVAYFLGKNQTRQIPNVQTSPTPTPNPTANWKTYLNRDYNFSFKYPPGFSIKAENKSDSSNVGYDFTFTTGKLIDGQNDWSGFSIFITPTNGKTINQEFSNQPSGFGDSVISVNSILPVEGADEAADLINSAQNARVYRVGKNFFQVEHFQNYSLLPDKSDDIMKHFDQILSTLKFTQ